MSVGVCWHVVFPGEALGVSGGCLWDVLRYLRGIHGNRSRLDVFGGYLGSHSLQYGAKTLFWYIPKMRDFFSPDHTETFRYQNGRITALQKSLGYAIFCDFYVCQRYITRYSCF